MAAVPYDVVSIEEARSLAVGNPLNFLRVSRAEIDLPVGSDPYGPKVYKRAAQNLAVLTDAVPLVVEAEPALYLYRLRTADHEQIGLVGCFSLDEYDRNVIRRHELTLRDKENDRTRHILALRAQTGIVFLVYRAAPDIAAVVERASCADPLLNVAASDGVQHTVWRLGREDETAVSASFARLPALYVADGHHRIAGAARARDELANPVGDDPEAEARFFLAVAFPDTETRILAYNRTVANLAGLTPEQFLKAVAARFPVRPVSSPTPPPGLVAMYLAGKWYAIDFTARKVAGGSGSRTAALDVALLQDQVMGPLLDVVDVRADPRVTFVAGARGTKALEQIVDSGTAAVAFSLAPVTTAELLAISDAGEIMPPKSTWFDPKPRDGLLIYLI